LAKFVIPGGVQKHLRGTTRGIPFARDFVTSLASNQDGKAMEPITMYTTRWCPDCRRTKSFLNERGFAFREVNIDEDESAEEIVIRANHGKRKVPTLAVGGRFFACSPFDPEQLAAELNIPLNP
jgi:mycoredoxin